MQGMIQVGTTASVTRLFPEARETVGKKQIARWVPRSREVKILKIRGRFATVGVPTPCGIEPRLAKLDELKAKT